MSADGINLTRPEAYWLFMLVHVLNSAVEKSPRAGWRATKHPPAVAKLGQRNILASKLGSGQAGRLRRACKLLFCYVTKIVWRETDQTVNMLWFLNIRREMN